MARASSWPPSGLNSSRSFEAGPGLQHVGPVLANSPSCVGHWARQRETGAQRPRGLGLVASPPTASVSLPAERWQVGFITSESEFWPASSVWRRCRQGGGEVHWSRVYDAHSPVSPSLDTSGRQVAAESDQGSGAGRWARLQGGSAPGTGGQ